MSGYGGSGDGGGGGPGGDRPRVNIELYATPWPRLRVSAKGGDMDQCGSEQGTMDHPWHSYQRSRFFGLE